MTISDFEETRQLLRQAGIKALSASGLCRTLAENAKRPCLSALGVEAFTEQMAADAYEAYRLLRQSGLIPQDG